MRHSLASALGLGAVLLLGACSVFEDKPASTTEAATATPATEAAPAPEPAAPRGVAQAGLGRAQPAAPSPVRYACTGTKDALTVTHAANGATARISFGTAAVNARRAGAGHYTAARTDLVEKDNAATLTWRGKKYSCKARG